MGAEHQTSDDQSLRLTEAALVALRAQPLRMRAVVGTLDHWDCVAPHTSKPLRDEWRSLLAEQAWERALDPGPKGQQLRQASPLGRALDPALRLAIIKSCKGRSSNT